MRTATVERASAPGKQASIKALLEDDSPKPLEVSVLPRFNWFIREPVPLGKL